MRYCSDTDPEVLRQIGTPHLLDTCSSNMGQDARNSMWKPVQGLLAAVLACSLSAACGRADANASAAAAPVTIRVSTGARAGSFRPLSEALVKGYAQLLPDLRIEAVNTPGSLGNLQ